MPSYCQCQCLENLSSLLPHNRQKVSLAPCSLEWGGSSGASRYFHCSIFNANSPQPLATIYSPKCHHTPNRQNRNLKLLACIWFLGVRLQFNLSVLTNCCFCIRNLQVLSKVLTFHSLFLQRQSRHQLWFFSFLGHLLACGHLTNHKPSFPCSILFLSHLHSRNRFLMELQVKLWLCNRPSFYHFA